MLKLAFAVLAIGLPLLLLPLAFLMIRTALKPTLYRGQSGQYAWLGHRLAGLGVVMFLFLHILETATLGLGPEVYNSIVTVYKTWWFRPFEVALAAAVIFHGVNGLKITLWDFWPQSTRWRLPIDVAATFLFLILFLPMVWSVAVVPFMEFMETR